jgi:hypothetical protein
MDIYAEFVGIVRLLQGANVEFAVCGGFAMALHGLPRFTEDIDLLVKSDAVERIVELLKSNGFEFDAGTIPLAVHTRHPFVLRRITKIVGENFITLDLLIVGPGLEDVWQDRTTFTYNELTVPAVSVMGLAKMKRLSGRPQDIVDIERLGINPDDPALQYD